MTNTQHGLVQRIVEIFLKGKLSAMLIAVSLIAGGIALFVTPREEDPQIVVPLADVIVQVPGASAREVERQVTTPLEKLLYQIDGVEYVYSMSKPNLAIVTVRFYVGEDREDSLVKLHNKIETHKDLVPASVTGWVIKPVEIDDVPIVAATLYSDRYSDVVLRRIAEELESKLQAVENTGKTYIIGGRAQQVHVELDPERLTSRKLAVDHVEHALTGANVTLPVGSFQQLDQDIIVDGGTVLRSEREVAALVIGVHDGRPVYLSDVAEISLAASEIETYTHLYRGVSFDLPYDASAQEQAPGSNHREAMPAVTVAVAKKKGANAVWVSRAVQAEIQRLAPLLFPDGVSWRITRDYGKTANDKVNELVEALGVAIVIVVALLAVVMGWREGLIVATAVPITFALTLLINYLAGYTINRVTLFALILALGLVVDDPIVDVENIYRHFKMRKKNPLDAVLEAINEVRPPIILATLAVIISFVPMMFITGMMGPYMRPMALNVPLAMLMSLVVAFTVTPWMSYHVLKGEYEKTSDQAEYDLRQTATYRTYARVVRLFLDRRWAAWLLLGGTAGLFVFSCLLAAGRWVPLKMLPFDNKNELQVVVDMPEGTTLERTAAATDALARLLQRLHEVADVTTYVGTASPLDFNGLVRHYYLRHGPNVADLRVNLVHKTIRDQQSHQIALRVRRDLQAIADRFDANIKVVEVPPGPPVISTLTVEVYGQPYHRYEQLQHVARGIKKRFRQEPGVEDIDSTIESEQTKFIYATDKEKAALSGLSADDIARTLKTLLEGKDVSVLHDEDDINPTPIQLRLPRANRSAMHNLMNLYVSSPEGVMIQLGELGHIEQTTQDQTIYHKNLRPVVYVFAEMVGRPPVDAIIDMYDDLKPGIPLQSLASAPGHPTIVPEGFEVIWTGEGEWKVTVDVFRDLGIAFGVACLGIYVLLVYQTSSYLLPLVLMVSIPLTVIGIMPGFWLLNLLWNQPVRGYDNPVYFTATAMIGMIALAGIAVRNAILLIDFIRSTIARGETPRQAILDSGAVRFRPIFLTAGTAMLAAIPITLDPIFSGLAWALIFGLFVSTAFTLLLIPVIYWKVYGSDEERPSLPR